ncbi:MAG: tripartite tricarboxylate transporter permease [Candidatus Anstonellales archaeon]
MLDLIFGMVAGVICGLIPGLHSNTVAALMENEGYFIVAMFAAQILFSFLPAIFFSVPDETTVLSVLPGQRMAAKGEGLKALRIVASSALITLFISILLYKIILPVYPFLFSAVESYIAYIVLLVVIVLIAKAKNPILYTAIFLVAGVLGKETLKLGLDDPFLPIFSSMFALPILIFYKKGKVVEQRDEAPETKRILAPSVLGFLLGIFAVILPGVSSPAQVATFASIGMSEYNYLAVLPSIAVSNGFYSFVSMATVEKARAGAVVYASKSIDIKENIDKVLLYFSISMAVAALILYFCRKMLIKLAGTDLKPFAVALAIYLVVISLFINGFASLPVVAGGFAIGTIANLTRTEKTSLMGAVILPTLLRMMF